jgi:hypothetical protein
MLAETGQSEAEFLKKLHTVISHAAAIPNAQWEKFATDPTGSPEAIEGEPFSLVLWSLYPSKASKENPDVLKDFRFLTSGMPKPTELHEAMSSSQPHGYVSMIQPEYIKSTTVDLDVELKGLRGSVEFESPNLYAGKVNFVIQFVAGHFRVVQFTLPNYGIAIVRDEEGSWRRYEARVDSSKRLAKMENPAGRLDPAPPDTIAVDLYGVNKAALDGINGAAICDIGPTRLAVLRRDIQPIEGTIYSLDLPVSGDKPKRGGECRHKGVLHFSYAYADGEVECRYFDLPFRISESIIHVGGESHQLKAGKLILIDLDNKVVETRPLQPESRRVPLEGSWKEAEETKPASN